MVDEWNSKKFAIQSHISNLTIVSFVENKVHKLEEIMLK